MANVVTLPDYGTNAIQQFVQSLSANRDRDQQRDYQTKSLGIQQQQVDQSGQADQARIQQAEEAARTGNVQAQAAVIQKGIDNLTKAGPDGIAQAKKIIEAVRQSKPAVGQHLFVQDDPTNADLATGNANKYLADSTGRAAAGGQDAQDRNLTTKAATGAFLPAEAFKDQVQRDPLAADQKTPYGQGAAIASGRKADAEATLQAQTSRANNSANIAADAPVRAAQVRNYDSQTATRGNQTSSGEDIDALVDQLVAGTYDPANMKRWKMGEQAQIAAAAKAKDPNFDMKKYPLRFAIEKDVTSGKAKNNIVSGNTVLSHIGELLKDSESLDNMGMPAANAVTNKIGTAFGGDKVSNFNTTKNAVANELGTYFKGSAGTDTTLKEWNANINENQSNKQLRGQLVRFAKLVVGRMNTTAKQYQQTMGKPLQVLDEEGRDVLTRLGVDTSKFHMAPAAPDAGLNIDTPSGGFDGAKAGKTAAPGAPSPGGPAAAPPEHDLVWDPVAKKWAH